MEEKTLKELIEDLGAAIKDLDVSLKNLSISLPQEFIEEVFPPDEGNHNIVNALMQFDGTRRVK